MYEVANTSSCYFQRMFYESNANILAKLNKIDLKLEELRSLVEKKKVDN